LEGGSHLRVKSWRLLGESGNLWETAQLDFNWLPLRYMFIVQPLHHPAQFYWYKDICKVTYSVLLGGIGTYTPNQIHRYFDYIPILPDVNRLGCINFVPTVAVNLTLTWHSGLDVNREETRTYSISWLHYLDLISWNALESQAIWTQKTFYFLSNNEDVLERTCDASFLSHSALCMMVLAKTVH
jgi:hypothetical protein